MVNLHTHSCFSLLDSIIKVDDLAKFASANNQKAIALTDHGYMYAFVNHVKACKKYGVKPIVGVEVYECDDPGFKSDTKEYTQPRYHLILLAKNTAGLKNIFKIVSEGCTNGFYKKPRVSVDWIKENCLGEGVICLTACMAGRLSKLLNDNKTKEADEFVNKLKDTFDYVCIELQSHNTKEQFYSNEIILNFAKMRNLPYCVTSDAHMNTPEQIDTQAIFIEIGEGREVGETYIDCYLQTEEDVNRILSPAFSQEIIKNAIVETERIADMVDDDIDYGIVDTYRMPPLDIPKEFESNKEYLRYLTFSTFEKKFGRLSEEEQLKRRDRINSEIEVLDELGFTNYLIMQGIIAKEADRRGLPRGYSRGSGANCLCLFMLDVTQIDSVRWDLDFTRFANLGRKGSVPD